MPNAIQAKATQGLSLSPILLNFQQKPVIPVECDLGKNQGFGVVSKWNGERF